jgi:hypothetical protein
MIFFVSDMFADQYIGGAELTSEAIISDSLLPMVKINSSRLSTRIMEANKDKFWILAVLLSTAWFMPQRI